MRSVFSLLSAVLAGLALGLGSAFFALQAGVGFNRLSIGAWVGSPRAGGLNADPYSRAELVRTGELPLGGGEGVTFTARDDDEGRRLDARCVYRIEGPSPPARLWTLTLYDADGRIEANPAERYGFTSRELLRAPDGSVAIAVAAEARPGNWLPIGRTGPFRLVLRLYDTPLANGLTSTLPELPKITRTRCG